MLAISLGEASSDKHSQRVAAQPATEFEMALIMILSARSSLDTNGNLD